MIVLKQPLELRSLRRITLFSPPDSSNLRDSSPEKVETQIQSDPFYSRISGNYSIINSKFTAEDLFFLINTPPEIPEFPIESGGINIQSNVSNSRSFSLNVLNNVVNRILFSDDSSYTYQDEVYISSFLRKIGVEDVSLFMRQVRELRQDSRNVHNLLNLYRQSVTNVGDGEFVRETLTAKRGESAGQNVTHESETRYTLHNDVYNRLQTSDIYQIMRNYTSNKAEISNRVRAAEFHTAEQSRAGDLISLTEIKRDLIGEDSAAELAHIHINRYETGEEIPLPSDESQVIQQSAAGVLLTLVDNLFTTRLEKKIGGENLWLDISNVIYNSAEKSLQRFQMFRTYKTVLSEQDRDISDKIRKLSQTEEFLLVEISTGHPLSPAETILAVTEDRESDSYSGVGDFSGKNDGDDVSAVEKPRRLDLYKEYSRSLIELNREKAALITPYTRTEVSHSSVDGGVDINTFTHTLAKKITQNISLYESVEDYSQDGNVTNFGDIVTEHISRIEDFSGGEPLQEEEPESQTTHELKQYLDEYDRRNRETAQRLIESASELKLPGDRSEESLPKSLRDKSETDDTLPRNVLQDVFGEAETTHLTLQPFNQDELSKMDETTRLIYQSLLGQKPGTLPSQIPLQKSGKTPSRGEEINVGEQINRTELTHKTEMAAGRDFGDVIEPSSVDEATRLVEEILSGQKPMGRSQGEITGKAFGRGGQGREEQEEKIPQMPKLSHKLEGLGRLLPEEAIAMAVADDATKLVYESLVRQRQGSDLPQSQSEMERKVLLFNTEMREFEKTAQTELFHKTERLNTETQTLYERTNTVTEKLRAATPLTQARSGMFQGAAQTVHKLPDNQGFSEELIEKLASRSNSGESNQGETSKTETIVNQTLSETRVNKMIQEQTAKSTEDITNLVNSTIANQIAKQMNVISEKVYNNMERRLSLEKARRGRI
ncbi:MAG: hypothetical protein FWG83_01100 [Oscillospiraceae bacterium]|nr:hypothetical protein [Oscillospiraceae bacterium]